MESAPARRFTLFAPAWLAFLCAVCAVAEGAAVRRMRVPRTATRNMETKAAAACISTVLDDAERRLAVLNGCAGMPRSLGSVYAGAITRFLDGFRGVAKCVRATAQFEDNSGCLAVSRDGSTLLVSDWTGGSHAIHVFRVADGAHLRSVGGYGDGALQFNTPRQVYVASDGFVFVADSENSRIQALSPQLDFHAFVGVGKLDVPIGVCANDDVIVVSSNKVPAADRICVFRRSDGVLLRRFGAGRLQIPGGLCFMPGERHIAVAEFCGGRVSVWSVGGEFLRHVGRAKLKLPASVACSSANELVVADYSAGGRIVVLSASDEVLWTSEPGRFDDVVLHGNTIFAQGWDGNVAFT